MRRLVLDRNRQSRLGANAADGGDDGLIAIRQLGNSDVQLIFAERHDSSELNERGHAADGYLDLSEVRQWVGGSYNLAGRDGGVGGAEARPEDFDGFTR